MYLTPCICLCCVSDGVQFRGGADSTGQIHGKQRKHRYGYMLSSKHVQMWHTHARLCV